MIKKQYGMTLIELAIGMMLGLALVASIGQLFSQSQKSFRLQSSLSDMTDDATFMLESLAKGLNQTGSVKNAQSDTGFPVDPDVLSSSLDFNINEKIIGDDNSVIYRFKFSKPSEVNTFICNTFLTYNEGDIVTVRIYKEDDDGIPVLYCRIKQTNPSTGVETVKNAQPLISDVQQLEFRYGIQIKYCDDKFPIANPNAPCPTQSNKRIPEDDRFYYTNAENVTDWTSVFAVKVFLVMRSADINLTRNQTGWQIENATPQIPAEENLPSGETADAHRIYKVFSKTIYLRATAQ